jgi:hypothetical protein
LKDDKASLECRLSGLENERKFDSIKYEQIENECMLLKNEIVKNEQIQPVIAKLQVQNLKNINFNIHLFF